MDKKSTPTQQKPQTNQRGGGSTEPGRNKKSRAGMLAICWTLSKLKCHRIQIKFLTKCAKQENNATSQPSVGDTHRWPGPEQWPRPGRTSPRTGRRRPARLHPPTLWAPSGIRQHGTAVETVFQTDGFRPLQWTKQHCMALTLKNKQQPC